MHASTIYEGPSVAGGTTYDAVDSPGGPFTSAIVGLGDQLCQQNLP